MKGFPNRPPFSRLCLSSSSVNFLGFFFFQKWRAKNYNPFFDVADRSSTKFWVDPHVFMSGKILRTPFWEKVVSRGRLVSRWWWGRQAPTGSLWQVVGRSGGREIRKIHIFSKFFDFSKKCWNGVKRSKKWSRASGGVPKCFFGEVMRGVWRCEGRPALPRHPVTGGWEVGRSRNSKNPKKIKKLFFPKSVEMV